MTARPQLLIYGSRSYARTVQDLALDLGWSVAGFIDDQFTGTGVVGTLAIATREFAPDRHALALGIGYDDLPGRWSAWCRVRQAGWQLPSLVHPRAYVARTATLGPGCVVMAGAVVDRAAALGEAVVVWPGACINHNVVVGSNSFVSPNATLCGGARVGMHVFIGAGALLVDHAEVPESSFVKMGARHTIRQP